MNRATEQFVAGWTNTLFSLRNTAGDTDHENREESKWFPSLRSEICITTRARLNPQTRFQPDVCRTHGAYFTERGQNERLTDDPFSHETKNHSLWTHALVIDRCLVYSGSCSYLLVFPWFEPAAICSLANWNLVPTSFLFVTLISVRGRLRRRPRLLLMTSKVFHFFPLHQLFTHISQLSSWIYYNRHSGPLLPD